MARLMPCDLSMGGTFDLPLVTMSDIVGPSSSYDGMSLDADDVGAHGGKILCGVKPAAVSWILLMVKMNDHGV